MLRVETLGPDSAGQVGEQVAGYMAVVETRNILSSMASVLWDEICVLVLLLPSPRSVALGSHLPSTLACLAAPVFRDR